MEYPASRKHDLERPILWMNFRHLFSIHASSPKTTQKSRMVCWLVSLREPIELVVFLSPFFVSIQLFHGFHHTHQNSEKEEKLIWRQNSAHTQVGTKMLFCIYHFDIPGTNANHPAGISLSLSPALSEKLKKKKQRVPEMLVQISGFDRATLVRLVPPHTTCHIALAASSNHPKKKKRKFLRNS